MVMILAKKQKKVFNLSKNHHIHTIKIGIGMNTIVLCMFILTQRAIIAR